ncbi:hypothetical protein SUGI_1174070 [Cryptomeria japonica]|nr:hypothetical protein SUGI_1174070 [Cryptomeria japonica]
MSHNHLSGVLPRSIGHLSSKLSILDFGNNQIRGNIPQQITNLTNLTYLNISNNLLSGYLPSGLKRFYKLERLDLSGNNIGGGLQEEIGKMKSLGELEVSWTNLSGTIPGSLGRLQQLRRLFLHHNYFSGEIPSGLQKCPNLELVDISHNHLSGNIPGEFMTSLKGLQFYLTISWNFLQGPLPVEISKIVSAQAIDISCNKLDGMIPSALANCLALEYLNLSNNAFEGPIPDALGKLKNLESVNLSFNFLSGTIPTSLTNMKVLRYFNACFNNLTGEVPKVGLFSNNKFNESFMGNNGLCDTENLPEHACPNQGKKLKSPLTKTMLSAAGVIAFLLCISIFGILCCRKYSPSQFDLPDFMFGRLRYPRLTYQELVNATNGFNETNLLRVGCFGSVFKGILRDGMLVAIKVLNFQNEELENSFKRECKILARTRHRNLVRVISAYSDLNFKVLILQFATNGSLEKLLYPESNEEDRCEVNIDECLNIAIQHFNNICDNTSIIFVITTRRVYYL